MRAPVLLTLLSVLLGCGSRAAPIGRVLSHPARAGDAGLPSGLARVPLSRPPGVRLPAEVVPRAYSLELEIDPRQERFVGRVRIEVELARATDVVFLHGQALHVRDASVTPAGGSSLRAVWEEVDRDEGLGALRVAATVGPGRATLEIAYDAPFDRELEGLYRVEHAGRSYAFTQMEPISARRAFPCFDEPARKTPFELALVVRASDVAIANTREVASETLPNGRRRARFARTEPLPTYLVAFAVGPLEVREAPALRSSDGREIPFRGVAPAGRGSELEVALRETPAIFASLERYTGVAYPYDKLDVIAVPDFSAGAMENAGAITFHDGVLLLSPRTSTVADERSFAYVMAHELAHQWFGDLVTPVWWDDLWLNESFATWLGWRTIAEVRPRDHADESIVGGSTRAMSADSRLAARRIRQPIESHHDIHNAFDGITYNKGAAVLAMFERWLGPEAFQRGIRLYLSRHRHANATAADFLAAVGEATGRDVATPFSTFLDQPGVPLLSAELECRASGRPIVRLAQRRYAPLGSDVPADGQRWQLPICLRYADGAGAREQCILLAEAAAAVELETDRCPRWITPNAGGAGYYRFAAPPALLPSLPLGERSPFDTREQLVIADSVRAAASAGTLSFADALAAVAPLAGSRERSLAVVPMSVISWARERVVEPAFVPRVEAYARMLYAPVLRRLGPRRAGEDDDERLLRSDVVAFLAATGRDPAVRRNLAREARLLLGLEGDGAGAGPGLRLGVVDRGEVPLELLGTVLVVGVQEGGLPAHEAALAALRATDDANLRSPLVGALVRGTSPELVERGRAVVLDPALRVSEVSDALFASFEEPETRAAQWEWFRARWDRLVARIARGEAGGLPWVGASFCDATRRAELEAFFAGRVDALPGGPRSLRASLETIRLCEAYAAAQRSSAHAFFAGHADHVRRAAPRSARPGSAQQK